MWATLVSPVPVVATFHSGATQVAALRRGGAGAAADRSPARDPDRGVGAPPPSSLAAGSAGSSRSCPTGSTSSGSRRLSRPTSGPGERCCSSVASTSGRGSRPHSRRSNDSPDEFDDVRLMVVGDGPDRDAVQRVPARVQARISMLGAVPNVELPPFSAASDAVPGCRRRRGELRHRAGGGDGRGGAGGRQRHPRLSRGRPRRGGRAAGPAARPGRPRGRGGADPSRPRPGRPAPRRRHREGAGVRLVGRDGTDRRVLPTRGGGPEKASVWTAGPTPARHRYHRRRVAGHLGPYPRSSPSCSWAPSCSTTGSSRTARASTTGGPASTCSCVVATT